MFPPNLGNQDVHLFFNVQQYLGWDIFLPFLPDRWHRMSIAKMLIRHWKLTSMPKDPVVFTCAIGTFEITDLRGNTRRFAA